MKKQTGRESEGAHGQNPIEASGMIKLVVSEDMLRGQSGGERDWRGRDQPAPLYSDVGGSSRNTKEETL